MKKKSILILLIPLFFLMGCQTAQQKAQHQARLYSLETKARNGGLLTENEWLALIQPPDGWHCRPVDWLYGMLGRPDESFAGLDQFSTFIIYKNKCLDNFTGKPTDLCLSVSFSAIDSHSLYDAQRVRNR